MQRTRQNERESRDLRGAIQTGIRSYLPGLARIGCLLLLILTSCEQEPSPPLSPEKALESFRLADPGLRIELVASEPLVQDPVAMTFDEGGRLWVVEMLGFMQDIEGSGEEDPVGRVSVLFDDDGDGRMDRSTVFLDSLVLPRAIGLVDGGVLVAENIPLWFAEDTDGDFKADRRQLVDSTYGGSGMPEHSANGLWRGMDNWIYNAKSSYRYRREGGEWIRDETEFRGQWGIAHDNAGRLVYNYNWSQLHADLVPPNSLDDNPNHTPASGIDHGLTLDRTIYPIRSNTAVNRGYVEGTLDEEGKLLEFASACGPLVYRGDALPADYLGDAFVCEPTANLIKQNDILENGFMLEARAVYPDREFLASTDERFRPISLAPGPDGALYVVDMYKGIIQHGPYMTDYLREVTLERKLDRPVHMGRIWRITRKSASPEPDRLEGLEPGALVGMLDSPNGWTRDHAQRLLVAASDSAAIQPLIGKVAGGTPLGKLHALWTLHGMGWTGPDVYLRAMDSDDPVVAQAALRILEPLCARDSDLQKRVGAFIRDGYEQAPPLVRMQMVLMGDKIPGEVALPVIREFLADYGALPVARDVAMSSLEGREMELFETLLAEAPDTAPGQDTEIFMEMLASAIANSGDAGEISDLLATVRDADADWVRDAIVHGILNARQSEEVPAIELAQQPSLFKGAGNDPLLASLQERFTWPGKPEIARDTAREAFDIDPALMATGRQQYLNLCASCHGTQGEGMRRFAPPLRGSEWVNGEDYKLAMILLHGMEGPLEVGGKRYDIPDILPSMPSFSTLQDRDIAAIATYIRNAWGNSNEPISRGTVTGIRFRTQGKIQPWTAAELDTLQFSLSN